MVCCIGEGEMARELKWLYGQCQLDYIYICICIIIYIYKIPRHAMLTHILQSSITRIQCQLGNGRYRQLNSKGVNIVPIHQSQPRPPTAAIEKEPRTERTYSLRGFLSFSLFLSFIYLLIYLFILFLFICRFPSAGQDSLQTSFLLATNIFDLALDSEGDEDGWLGDREKNSQRERERQRERKRERNRRARTSKFRSRRRRKHVARVRFFYLVSLTQYEYICSPSISCQFFSRRGVD